ncbi:MAG: D-tyrosyl-tRNA(Tyr) deacylase [Bacilli bacterium]|nr:D-tyrosyl-tRNA(Tyr) deacylase [Bacilli bacterium]
MRVLVQRCKYARVSVDKKIVGEIDNGIMALVGFTDGDDINKINYMVDKLINLRIFDDENGVMNKSLVDTNGSILSVSQFTLYADTSKGRRPSYVNAMKGEESSKLYDLFNSKLIEAGINIGTGIFGADMEVELLNDGPVTVMLEK